MSNGKQKCRVCGSWHVPDLTTIDTLAPEKREVYNKIYERFQLPDGTCGCPLCKAIKNRENADD